MATKKQADPAPDDALDDDDGAEEAGLVPKGDDADSTEGEYTDDSVTVDVIYEPPDESVDAGPPPSTPSSSTEVSMNRALFEDQVNAAADAFGAQARLAYIDAALAGRGIAIVVDDDDAVT